MGHWQIYQNAAPAPGHDGRMRAGGLLQHVYKADNGRIFYSATVNGDLKPEAASDVLHWGHVVTRCGVARFIALVLGRHTRQ
jgi:hypothetical protein